MLAIVSAFAVGATVIASTRAREKLRDNGLQLVHNPAGVGDAFLGRYVFLSNHRDIVLDSAFLDVSLEKHGFDRTVEIGIGDNLLIYPWIKKLVRMNKAFTVRRGLTTHEMMRSSVLMSQYIHFAVNGKQENVWIAQREGRAKDSDDRTQDSVLKMFCLGAPEEIVKRPGLTPGGSVVEALKDLYIIIK